MTLDFKSFVNTSTAYNNEQEYMYDLREKAALAALTGLLANSSTDRNIDEECWIALAIGEQFVKEMHKRDSKNS